ncbi:MAG: twin-arginine translocation signal domain-containing protein, partial [Terriglobia bacterium]
MAKRGYTSRRGFLKESAFAAGGLAVFGGLASPGGRGAESNATGPGGIRPVNLCCEYRKEPLGIDALEPRLSWVLDSTAREARGQMQSAYQILAASSEELLRSDQGDLWDTGKVESSRSTQVAYSGKPLASGRPVLWKVRIWDQSRTPSSWSEMG